MVAWSVACEAEFKARRMGTFRGSAVILWGMATFWLFRPGKGERKAPKFGLARLANAGLLPFGLAPECLFADHAPRPIEAREAAASAEGASQVFSRFGKPGAAMTA